MSRHGYRPGMAAAFARNHEKTVRGGLAPPTRLKARFVSHE